MRSGATLAEIASCQCDGRHGPADHRRPKETCRDDAVLARAACQEDREYHQHEDDTRVRSAPEPLKNGHWSAPRASRPPHATLAAMSWDRWANATCGSAPYVAAIAVAIPSVAPDHPPKNSAPPRPAPGMAPRAANSAAVVCMGPGPPRPKPPLPMASSAPPPPSGPPV